MLSGRFADAFSTLYLGYSCLWYYKHNRHVDGIDDVFEYSMEQLLHENEAAIQHLSKNFPLPMIGPLMSLITTPFGTCYEGPTDKMRIKASQAITTMTGIRDLLSQGIYISDDSSDRLRQMNDALPICIKADTILTDAKKHKRSLTNEEEKIVSQAIELANVIIQVDSFDKLGSEKNKNEEYVRPALLGTKFAAIQEMAHVGAR
jgi:acyl-CoA dehydrogenase